MASHQALLLQAQDDEIKDKKAERQYAAIQNPKLADSVSQELRNDKVFSEYPCSSNTSSYVGHMNSVRVRSKANCGARVKV